MSWRLETDSTQSAQGWTCKVNVQTSKMDVTLFTYCKWGKKIWVFKVIDILKL